jgi:hypothetical protein
MRITNTPKKELVFVPENSVPVMVRDHGLYERMHTLVNVNVALDEVINDITNNSSTYIKNIFDNLTVMRVFAGNNICKCIMGGYFQSIVDAISAKAHTPVMLELCSNVQPHTLMVKTVKHQHESKFVFKGKRYNSNGTSFGGTETDNQLASLCFNELKYKFGDNIAVLVDGYAIDLVSSALDINVMDFYKILLKKYTLDTSICDIKELTEVNRRGMLIDASKEMACDPFSDSAPNTGIIGVDVLVCNSASSASTLFNKDNALHNGSLLKHFTLFDYMSSAARYYENNYDDGYKEVTSYATLMSEIDFIANGLSDSEIDITRERDAIEYFMFNRKSTRPPMPEVLTTDHVTQYIEAVNHDLPVTNARVSEIIDQLMENVKIHQQAYAGMGLEHGIYTAHIPVADEDNDIALHIDATMYDIKTHVSECCYENMAANKHTLILESNNIGAVDLDELAHALKILCGVRALDDLNTPYITYGYSSIPNSIDRSYALRAKLDHKAVLQYDNITDHPSWVYVNEAEAKMILGLEELESRQALSLKNKHLDVLYTKVEN